MIKHIYTTKSERDIFITTEEGNGNLLYQDNQRSDESFLIFATPAEYESLKPLEQIAEEEYKKLEIASITPDQVDTYIDNNVTDLASAKETLKLLAKGLIRVAKKAGM